MSRPRHYVAIFGGAVSGSEAAYQFSEKGIKVAVFEQNILPYGKIEDGLPKWHVRLRDKEEGKINDKLSHPLVEYVPQVALGESVDFETVAKEWGFSAVLLANGAWKDRPLPIEGIDDFIGKGLYYQNPFIYWYNHYHEPQFQGESYETPDGAIIIGGGLASLDVAKVLMFENVQKALTARGHEVDLFTLDRSIAKVLDGLGLSLEDLGLKGCTLYYRRRVQNMPLTPMDTDTPEKLAKAETVRQKVFSNYQSKYLFNFEPLRVPIGKIVENERLAGLVMQRTQLEDGRVRAVAGSEEEVRAPLVISSIGSIPMPIPGLPMRGSVYDILETECCRVAGYDRVFALGNAVTGRGNIVESARHGRKVSQEVIENLAFDREVLVEKSFREREDQVSQQVDHIADQLPEPLSDAAFEALDQRVKSLQAKGGYTGDFKAWAAKHTPMRLEHLLGVEE